MSIKLLNEKRMDELIQFIHQEEITKKYLKQNQKIIYIYENQSSPLMLKNQPLGKLKLLSKMK